MKQKTESSNDGILPLLGKSSIMLLYENFEALQELYYLSHQGLHPEKRHMYDYFIN